MHVFVTGASGWIGSALVPDLLDAGHSVTGLARSDAAAATLQDAGATPVRGDLDDLDVLVRAARESEGVIHLAFKHDIAFSGDFAAAAEADRRAVEALGDALAGSDRALLIASGVLGLRPGWVSTEEDGAAESPNPRAATAELALGLATRDVRSGVVRLAPTVHGEGDNGFMAALVGIARGTGVAGYLADGSSRWPAVHRSDAARLFRLAVERAPAGSVLHAVAEEGVATRAIAEAIGQGLGLPTRSIPEADAAEHFGFLAGFLGLDSPASSELTRERLDWQPTGPGLLADLAAGHYFRA